MSPNTKKIIIFMLKISKIYIIILSILCIKSIESPLISMYKLDLIVKSIN